MIEAGARSGALRTAQRAHELGRHVGAVPGPETSAASVGPHELIGDGRALIVTDAGQITNMLHMREDLRDSPQRSPLGIPFTRDKAPRTTRRDGPSL